MERVTAILMLGGEGPGAAEQWVQGGRLAALRDAVHLAAGLPEVDRLVVATSERPAAEANADLPVVWDFDLPGASFHFGRRLGELTERFPAQAYLYLGAGSIPLLPQETLAQAVGDVRRAAAPTAVTNNLYSSDWMVFNCPAAVRARPQRLEKDNSLGWVLQTEAGVAVESLPASAATRMDLDTPADLQLLELHPRTGPELAAYLRAHPRDATRWAAVRRVLATPGRQAALIGRVASAAWSHVEARTQVWLRVFSEERGMSASGRQAAGAVKSLVAAHLIRLGPQAFFAELSELADAVLFDTRVALAHQQLWPTAGDRYASDLGQPDEIGDPFLRALTAAAGQAPMPVVLGGHGVVSGGLYALLEIEPAV
jgi:hypothetical protein